MDIVHNILAYETPDGGWWQAWNYRVSQKTVSDGQSGGSKIAYAYTPLVGDRCYVDPMNSDAFGCYFFSPMSTTGGSLVGYRFVTETLKTLGDTPIAVTAHVFVLDTLASPNRSKGRESELYRLDATGIQTQQAITTTWVVSPTQVITNTYTYFVYAQWIKESTREGNGLPSTPQKKTYYAYEPERGGQYGNLTYVLEYQGDTAYRRTRTHFYPNTAAWIVDRPAVITSCNASDIPQTITRLYYDGAANYATPPQRGDVSKKEQTTSVGASPVWITTQTIAYKDSTYYYLPYIVADGNDNRITTDYDSTWRMYPITVTNALGQATAYEYNYVLGKAKKVTGPNGSTTATSYEYDEFGRLTKIIRPGDSSTYPTVKYEYCDTCSPFRILTTQRLVAGGSDIPTLRFYNGIGQLIQENKGTTDRSQMTVRNTVYNAQGLADKAYVPYFATYSINYQTPDTNQPKTTYAYDALGRTTVVANTDSTAARAFYDGLKKAVLDENNHQRIYENDAFGRLITVKEYTGTYASGPNWTATAYATTTYAYSTLDLLITVTDALGNQTTMTYDALGRKTAMTDPDMGSWTYAYDNAGNLTRQTDARGQRICFYYDALNRLKGKHYRDNDSCPPASNPQLNVGYSYDATAGGNLGIGYRTAMSDTISGSTAWKYDARGRVITETKTINGTGGGTFTTQWTYNSADLVVTQVYPGSPAETVTTTYDRWGHPSALAGSNTYVSSATYDAFDRLDVVQFGNGQRTDHDYYPMTQKGGRLYEIKTGSTSPYTGTQYLRYDYDSVGNVTSITDFNNRTGNQSQVQSFTYDHLDRLTAASTNAYGADQYTETYAYSPIGNLVTKTGVGNYTYGTQSASCPDGALTKPHAVVTAGGNTYCYDRNGNMVKRTGSFTLTYDAENRLTGVSGAATATFAYDGDGNRVRATVGVTTTVYVGTYFETGTAWAKYYYFAGQRVAMRTTAGVTYIHGDHLGSATNTTGASTNTQRYYPWGAQRGTGQVTTPYRFTGQREESTIGLYFYNARWYDAALARFAQADTIVPAPGNPQSLNRYSYTLNNPVNYTDPSGHWTEEELERILGKDWRTKYFGRGGVFEGRERLLAFLVSSKTTGLLALAIVGELLDPAADLHSLGADFAGIDAIGSRINIAGGGILFGAFTGDVVLNIEAGQMSAFLTFEGGGLIGLGATLTGGLTLMKNVPTNDALRGVVEAVGLQGGDIVGGCVEVFWSGPMADSYNPGDKSWGVFFGAGGAANGGLSVSLGYSVELYRLDDQGHHWGPHPPTLGEVLLQLGLAIRHDILAHPIWRGGR